MFVCHLGSECVETSEYYASLQPEGIKTASEGEVVNLMCSTNLPLTYPSQWEINGYKHEIVRLPYGFTANGLNLIFNFETRVIIRCIFRISLSGSVANICSNTTTVVLLDSVPESCG